MDFLSATNFFSEVFTWFANLSAKLPQIDYKTYFIVVVALLIGVGVIVGFTFFGTYRFKLMHACRKIIKYLKDVESIDDDNFGDFTTQCFSQKAPAPLRDSWVQYLGVRFGYPSDIVSEENVYDKPAKRVREIRANIYIAIALVMLAVFAFWGYGTLDGKDMGVIFLAGLLLSGVVYLVLVILNRLLSKRCLDAFDTMQEDLDAKVNLQVEKRFSTDSSPLFDLSAIIDEIVTRNTAKELGFEFSEDVTPIEQLIAEAEASGKHDEIEIDYINSEEPQKQDDVVEDVHNVESVADEAVEDDAIDDELEEAVQEEIAEISQTEEPQKNEEVEAVEVAVESETVEENSIEEEVQEPAIDETEPTEVAEEELSAKEKIIEEAQTSDTENTENDIIEEAINDEVEEAEEPVATEVGEEKTEPQSEATEEVTETVEETAEKDVADEEGDEIEDDDIQQEPEVRYVVDGPAEDDEIVKPAKLVKLPNLVDYMLAQKLSRKVKINMAMMLLSSYKKFENSPDDKAIILGCMKKLMFDLQSKK